MSSQSNNDSRDPPVPVLLLARGGPMDGAQRQLAYLIEGLDRSAFDPIVVLDRPGASADAIRQHARTHILPLHAWRSWQGLFLRNFDARRLETLARRYKVRLIHVSDPRRAGYALHLAQRLGIPSVIHVRGPIDRDRIRKHHLDCASALLPIAARYERVLMEADIDPGRIFCIDDAVDVRRFMPHHPDTGRFRREWGASARPVVALVGRIEPFKDTLQFLRIVEHFRRTSDIPALCLIIGGAGHRTYVRQVEEMARRQGLSDCVRLMGRCEEMPAVLSAIDLLVTLSGGSVMFEAMACGTPVLSIRDMAQQSVHLRHGETGWCVRKGCVESAAEALRLLLSDAALRDRLGQAGRQWVVDHLSTPRLVARTEAVYAKLLGQAPAIKLT